MGLIHKSINQPQLINDANAITIFHAQESNIAGEIDVAAYVGRNFQPAAVAFTIGRGKPALVSDAQPQPTEIGRSENSGQQQPKGAISLVEKAEQLDLISHPKWLTKPWDLSLSGANPENQTNHDQLSTLDQQLNDRQRLSTSSQQATLVQSSTPDRPPAPDQQVTPDQPTTSLEQSSLAQSANSNQPPSSNWPPKLRSAWRSSARLAATMIMIIAFTIAAAIIVPELYYTIFTGSAVEDVAKQAQEQQLAESRQQVKQPYQPVKNPELPEGAWVNIPRIGVYSELIASENPAEALDKGTWLVPDFGRPGDSSQPTIIAAHRYGWDWWWQSDYWKYNSFYLLTETQPGDRVEVIYDQRRWVYEIYDAEEGELITDYSADLILYTCKHLNSPIRHFRYARVVEV